MLAIDCGNSRIKWRRRVDGRTVDEGAGGIRDAGAFAAVGRAVAEETGRILIANVAGPEVAARLAGLAPARPGHAPEWIRVTARGYGIECGYDDPATLGVDRWLAMIAVRRDTPTAFVVVGAGTALTVDAVDQTGRHRGGLILPGDTLMIDALAAGTEQITRVPRAGAPLRGGALFGRSTVEAVGRGCRLALAAAVDRALREFAAELAAEPALILTGGDAARLAPWLDSDATIRADLVLEGLAAIAATSE